MRKLVGLLVLALALALGAPVRADNTKKKPKPKPTPVAHRPKPGATVPGPSLAPTPPILMENGVPVRYQAPVNNPDPRYRHYRAGRHPEKLQWAGVVTVKGLDRIQIQGRGPDGRPQTVEFATDGRTRLGRGIKEGSTVVVDYDGTPDVGDFRAVNVNPWPTTKPLPHHLIPPQTDPTKRQ